MVTPLEKVLTSTHKPAMVKYVAAHPGSFTELISLTLADRQPYSWRASWLLWSCMEKNDPRVRKYIGRMIKILPDRKDNRQRELLKILHQMEIGEKHAGTLFSHCVDIWKNISSQPSARFNAFKMLTLIAENHPGLLREINFLASKDYLESLSPGVRRSIQKMLKKINLASPLNNE